MKRKEILIQNFDQKTEKNYYLRDLNASGKFVEN
jgi:hypothetical protein